MIAKKNHLKWLNVFLSITGVRLDDEEIQRMIQEADIDGNGEINLEGE